MGNLFDSLQQSTYNTVTKTMGYDAVWIPSEGNTTPQSARVLFNGPTEKEKLLSATFDPDKLTMEYQVGYFMGLKDFSDDNKMEKVNIDGVGNFRVRSVRLKFDGKTFEANLVIVPGEFNRDYNNDHNI